MRGDVEVMLLYGRIRRVGWVQFILRGEDG